MGREAKMIRKQVGRKSPGNPLTRLWELNRFLKKMGTRARPEDDDGEPIRKVVGRPR